MRNHFCLVLFVSLCSVSFGQVDPVRKGELSSTQLLSVERLVSNRPDQGPDGLSFRFLVKKKPPAEYEFGLKETRDFDVLGESYRKVTETTLGRVFEPHTTVDDAAEYVAEHPKLAAAVPAAPQGSAIMTVVITGSPLKDGQDVEVKLNVGFGRTAGTPESEELTFRTKVPTHEND
jgi:hypothetical protein